MFKEFPPKLGDSLPGATKRFHVLEKRFTKDTNFKITYQRAFQEYFKLNHIEKIENIEFDQPVNYFAYQRVIKSSSLTTKLRIVFDGSQVTSNGKSELINNELWLTGPFKTELFIKSQESIFFSFYLLSSGTKPI